MISLSNKTSSNSVQPDFFNLSRRAIPRAFSLLMSINLICSGLAFTSFSAISPASAADEAAPSWNENSTSAVDVKTEKSDAKVQTETKTEEKVEVKSDVKTEVKTEAAPVVEVKNEITVTDSKPVMLDEERKADAKVKTKREKKAKESKTAAVKDEKKAVESAAAPVETVETKAVETKAAETKAAETVVTETSPEVKSETKTEVTTSSADKSDDKGTSTTSSTSTTNTTSTTSTTSTNAATTSTGAETSESTATTGEAAATTGEKSSIGLTEGTMLAPDAAPQVGGALNTVDSLSGDEMVELGATVNTTSTGSSADGRAIAVLTDGVMVIDSDESSEVEEEIKYENLPTDEGKTRIKTGARFPVVVTSQISSKNAHKGDGIEARLKYDLKIGDRLVAKKGSAVHGHINYALPARSVMHSLVSANRWYRNSGCLGVEFDEIINEKNEHLPLVAAPAKNALIVKNKAEGRVLGVNHLGQVAGPWEQQLKYKAIRIGLNAALAPAGVFSFGAMPVALGVMGAVNPSFAFMKPVGTNVRHRRIKGFAWGFLSGVPGSWLIEDTVVKGNEAIIKPGDEFLAEFRQEFTGEPASEAQMLPNAAAKVHGDVRTSKKKKDEPAAKRD
jgi:hypothetical protein